MQIGEIDAAKQLDQKGVAQAVDLASMMPSTLFFSAFRNRAVKTVSRSWFSEPLWRRRFDVLRDGRHSTGFRSVTKLFGHDGMRYAWAANDMGEYYLLFTQEKEKARDYYQEAIAVAKKMGPQTEPQRLAMMSNLLVIVVGDDVAREALIAEMLDIIDRLDFSSLAFQEIFSIANVSLMIQESKPEKALDYYRRCLRRLSQLYQYDPSDRPDETALSKTKGRAEGGSYEVLLVSHFIQAAWLVAVQKPELMSSLAKEAFVISQRDVSGIGSSLMRVAERISANNPKLADLQRKLQDLQYSYRAVSERFEVSLRNDFSANSVELQEQRDKLRTIDRQLSTIKAEIERTRAEFSTVITGAETGADVLQTLLSDDEVLIQFFLSHTEKGFVWVLSKNGDITWKRLNSDTEMVEESVRSLRCGLDPDAWRGPMCRELVGQTYSEADNRVGKPLPFDQSRAYNLYQALFNQTEDLIKGKQLLVVLSGPLTQLPFQVLVTAPPVNDDYKSAAWLIRDHSITVLPSVSSLKALRLAPPTSAPN